MKVELRTYGRNVIVAEKSTIHQTEELTILEGSDRVVAKHVTHTMGKRKPDQSNDTLIIEDGDRTKVKKFVRKHLRNFIGGGLL